VEDDGEHRYDHPPLGGAVGGGQECLACPICVLLQALSTTRPEVLQHLLAAGRELTLALQAVVDSQRDAHERGTGKAQRINVE
jgi:hypothetical protein